jgi:hypothetical protein
VTSVRLLGLPGSKFTPIFKTCVLHLEAGKKRLPGHTKREASPSEVAALRKANARLVERVAKTTLESVQLLAVKSGFVGYGAIGCDATNVEPG